MPLLVWVCLLLMRRDVAPSPTGCAHCGCPRSAHEHYRPGLDCGRCGAQACSRYVGGWRAHLRLARELLRLAAAR
jgi:hypothetical protein